MTPEAPLHGDRLDDAIDSALRTMTDAEAIERASRARTRARLAEAAEGSSADRRRATPWPWIVVPASLVLVILSVWFTRPPTPSATLADTRPIVSRLPVVAPSAPIATVPVARSPRVEAQSAVERVVRRAAPQPQPDRLAAYLQALQQIPPDVWQRVDTARPPEVAALEPPASAPIAPITIGEIPASSWPDALPTATPPGESR